MNEIDDMPFYVYILRSEKDGTLYTGQTENMQKRLQEHNSGKIKSTKSKIPYKLIYLRDFSDSI